MDYIFRWKLLCCQWDCIIVLSFYCAREKWEYIETSTANGVEYCVLCEKTQKSFIYQQIRTMCQTTLLKVNKWKHWHGKWHLALMFQKLFNYDSNDERKVIIYALLNTYLEIIIKKTAKNV